MRSTTIALALFVLLSGCAADRKIQRLSNAEFDHYYALTPFMSEDQRKAFLKLKTEEERNQYLKDQDLWGKWYKYSEEDREKILTGEVGKGWTKEMVYMAWGAPQDVQKLVGRSTHRAERLIYHFEGHADGTILVYAPNSKTVHKATRLFTRAVEMENDMVTAVIEKDGWE